VAADNDLTLTASQLPVNKFGYFLTSQTQAFVQQPGGSQGNLCLGGAIGRYVGDVASSGPNGELVLAIDMTDMPGPDSFIDPGETWNFQCWFRDKNPELTSNFTDGIALQFF
jgi:hypothetical protein